MARTPLAGARRSEPVIGEGWVKPRWLERLSATGSPGSDANDSQRRWTVVGNLGSPHMARVDLRGLVSVDGQPWSLDWWVGAEDRWRIPSREAAVRQVAVGSAPVVETRLSVPGGDAVHRVFAARDATGVDAVVIEIENASRLPFALAISLRPYSEDLVGGLHEVAVDGSEMYANGRLAALLPSAPRHTASSAGADGDAAETVFSGAAAGGPPAGTHCPDGLASLTVLHPLSHTATFRIVVPLGGKRPSATGLPDVAAVVSGWQAHGRSATRIELPDRRLQGALDTSLRHLLARADGPFAAHALDRFGFHQLAARYLRDDHRPDGATGSPPARLVELVEHWSAESDPATARQMAPEVAALVAAMGSSERRQARWSRVRLRGNDLDEGTPRDDVVATAERESARLRLGLVAELFDAAGERRAAHDVRATAETLPHTPAHTPAPGTGSDAMAVADAATSDGHGRLSVRATLRLARAELVGPDPQAALARLSWSLGTASGTWTWPAAFQSDDTVGGMGDGHDLAANALLCLLVREMLVKDLGGELALSPVVPDAWLGQGWELHDAPTTRGRLSFAVRWHGERPALLWDIDDDGRDRAVRLTAPALDPSWSSGERRGEALLAPVAMPERPARRGLSIPVSIEPARRGPS